VEFDDGTERKLVKREFIQAILVAKSLPASGQQFTEITALYTDAKQRLQNAQTKIEAIRTKRNTGGVLTAAETKVLNDLSTVSIDFDLLLNAIKDSPVVLASAIESDTPFGFIHGICSVRIELQGARWKVFEITITQRATDDLIARCLIHEMIHAYFAVECNALADAGGVPLSTVDTDMDKLNNTRDRAVNAPGDTSDNEARTLEAEKALVDIFNQIEALK
jgi:hypothetical protein